MDEKYQQGDPPSAERLADDVIVSPDTRRAERIPPGQSRTRKWPVLDASGTPRFDPDTWQLSVTGEVQTPRVWDRESFRKLPRCKVFSDFHCVTQWSRLGNLWEGVSSRTLLEQVTLLSTARFVILHGYDNDWTTNLPLEEFKADDVLLADLHDGQPISADHGGPVRVVVPRLYAWKSAKWIRQIEFSATDRPGYWEQAGYHSLGDPWREQRFG